MPTARTFIIGSQTPRPLSAILMKPRKASACFVLAHGAGADMSHTFMEEIATSLYDRRIATFRYQFPFMENGSRRPDRPPIAHDAVRIAVTEARRRCCGLPRFAGGKSFGGRMTSQAQALLPLADVQGLIFLGFPLHTPAKPSDTRADHLYDVHVPMLFIQGTRDKLAHLPLLMPVLEELRGRTTLHLVPDADHSLQLPARRDERVATR